jgi:transposase
MIIGRRQISQVYLASQYVDIRKSINGLSILVKEGFELDPFQEALFVFCNKSRNKIKILHWDKNGFWLYYKRLERGSFKWPTSSKNQLTKTVSSQELWGLLDGLTLEQSKGLNGHLEVMSREII